MHTQGSNVGEPIDLYPDWVSWDLTTANLPPSYHTEDGFTAFLKALEHVIDDTYPSRELYALAVGLAFRDITDVLNRYGNLPTHLKESPLGAKHISMLGKLCTPTVEQSQVNNSHG